MPASSPAVASSSSTLKPRRSAQRIIIRSTISAQSWASVPPAPALTVTSASPASYLPENRRSSSSAARRASTEANASSSSAASSSSSSASSTRPSRSSASACSFVNASSLRCVRVCSALDLGGGVGVVPEAGRPHLGLERAQALLQRSGVKGSPRAGTLARGWRPAAAGVGWEAEGAAMAAEASGSPAASARTRARAGSRRRAGSSA